MLKWHNYCTLSAADTVIMSTEEICFISLIACGNKLFRCLVVWRTSIPMVCWKEPVQLSYWPECECVDHFFPRVPNLEVYVSLSCWTVLSICCLVRSLLVVEPKQTVKGWWGWLCRHGPRPLLVGHHRKNIIYWFLKQKCQCWPSWCSRER